MYIDPRAAKLFLVAMLILVCTTAFSVVLSVRAQIRLNAEQTQHISDVKQVLKDLDTEQKSHLKDLEMAAKAIKVGNDALQEKCPAWFYETHTNVCGTKEK